MTLGQKTRWAYSTMLLSPHEARETSVELESCWVDKAAKDSQILQFFSGTSTTIKPSVSEQHVLTDHRWRDNCAASVAVGGNIDRRICDRNLLGTSSYVSYQSPNLDMICHNQHNLQHSHNNSLNHTRDSQSRLHSASSYSKHQLQNQISHLLCSVLE